MQIGTELGIWTVIGFFAGNDVGNEGTHGPV
jgi:hypothetical protein